MLNKWGMKMDHIRRTDNAAVSPVIGVILMVAITIVLAGVVYLWVVQLSDHEEVELDHFTFEFVLDSNNDVILMELQSGPLISSRYFTIKLDGINGTIPEQNMYAGDAISITSPIDMISGSTYNIKLIQDYTVIWDEDYIAQDL